MASSHAETVAYNEIIVFQTHAFETVL